MRKICTIAVTLFLCCSALCAQEKSDSSLSIWIKNLQQKISQLVPKKSLNLSTGVAGTRGAREDASVKLYWKGKKGDEQVSEEELLKFKEGVDQAGKGAKDESVKTLEDFMKQYPDSALIPDAKKTLDLVKAEIQNDKKGMVKVDQKDAIKEEKK